MFAVSEGNNWLTLVESLPDVAVPRNTIYAAYVDLCAKQRLKALTSASFGRCVRMVYPDVSTRRLGVRGESKYHYCGIRLVGDDSGLRTANQVSVRKEKYKLKESRRKPALGAALQDVFNTAKGKHLPGKWMQELQKDSSLHPVVPIKPISSVDFSGLQRPTSRLVFLTPELQSELDEPQPFELPQIYDYLPDDADAEIQDTLVQSYYMHCVELIEAVASMKIRHFVSLNQSFYHTLSPEVQQLLSTPSLATWVQKVDLGTYQQITKILTPLCHQVIPPEIFVTLRNLSMTLLPNIHQSLASYAPHLLQAKLIPAGQFASLLARLLRVNETAHAAARFLTNSADRELMRMDWIRFVDPKAVSHRELSCGEEEVVVILDDILNLLGPSKSNRGASTVQGSPTPLKTNGDHSELMDGIEAMEQTTAGHSNGSATSGTEPVLDLWSNFLSSLPHRFPTIEPRLFLLCMGAVESSVLRDITVAGGEGFGALWVVRCWVDEMMRFLCERGGFLLEQVYDQFDDDEDDGDLDFGFNFGGNNNGGEFGGEFLFGGGQVEPLLSGQQELNNGWAIGLDH